MSDFTIVEDTRERKPWNFEFFGVAQTRTKVDAGDYTIVGYEDKITIDRKQDISELNMNLFKEYKRFKKEMERMEGMEAYILCEFPYSDVLTFPDSMPMIWSPKEQRKVKINVRYTSQHIIDRMELLTERHGVHFVFCDNRSEAEREAYRILKEFHDSVKKTE